MTGPADLSALGGAQIVYSPLCRCSSTGTSSDDESTPRLSSFTLFTVFLSFFNSPNATSATKLAGGSAELTLSSLCNEKKHRHITRPRSLTSAASRF